MSDRLSYVVVGALVLVVCAFGAGVIVGTVATEGRAAQAAPASRWERLPAPPVAPIPVAVRMEIFNALLEAAQRAEDEYDPNLPSPDTKSITPFTRHLTRLARAQEHYRVRVRNDYGLTEKQISLVIGEGLQEGWPRGGREFPPRWTLRSSNVYGYEW